MLLLFEFDNVIISNIIILSNSKILYLNFLP